MLGLEDAKNNYQKERLNYIIIVANLMDNLSRVFLPLRSNIGWFQSSDLRNAVSNRVKESILLYDELHIEDGTFQADIVDGYAGPIKWYHPPSSTPLERRTIEERDLKPTDMTIGIGPDGATSPTAIIMKGNASTRFKIDYYDIFKNIELSEHKFLKFIVLQNDYNIPNDARDIIESQSRKDKDNFRYMHPNKVIRDLVIDNLNHDLVASILLKSSVIIDSTHHDLLKKKCCHKESPFGSKPVIESIALREILNIEVPDFSNFTLEQVLESREERSWSEFRDFIRSITSSVKDDPEILTDAEAVKRVIQYNYTRALSRELEKRLTTGSKLGIDLGLELGFGCIPGLSAIPTVLNVAKSAKSYWEDSGRWYAFIFRLKSISSPDGG